MKYVTASRYRTAVLLVGDGSSHVITLNTPNRCFVPNASGSHVLTNAHSSCRRTKTITHPPHIEDVLGVTRIRFELSSKVEHIDFHQHPCRVQISATP